MRRVNVNGSHEFWQLGTLFNPVLHANILSDCWRIQDTTGSVLKAERSFDVPTFAESGLILKHSLKLTVLKPVTSLPPSTLCGLVYSGEGYQWRGLHRRPTTRRFWIRPNRTGVLSAGLRTGVAPYLTCGMAVPITTANVWQPTELNMPASPADGGWGFDSGIGYAMFLFFAATPNWISTSGEWVKGPRGVNENQTNWLDEAGTTIHITADQLEAGETATPFEHWPVQVEQTAVARYIQKSFGLWQKPVTAAGITNGVQLFSAPRPSTPSGSWQGHQIRFNMGMRVAPPGLVTQAGELGITLFNPEAANCQIRDWDTASDLTNTTVDNISEFGFHVIGYSCNGGDAGHTLGIGWVANASVPPA